MEYNDKISIGVFKKKYICNKLKMKIMISPKNSPQNDRNQHKKLLINLLACCNPFFPGLDCDLV